MGSDAPPKQKRVYNVNVGILGHVDSGKTSLVAALSTTLSTAALDKHPQSKERGITLDLGFSSFAVSLPERLDHLPFDELQVTLVDCPGHASLIKTIIGGAQIIDMMLLVVDVNRGIQTQTAECLVVGELATKDLIVVLNKVDLLPEEGRSKIISKAKKRLSQTLNATKFAGCTMIPTAVKPGIVKVPLQPAHTTHLVQKGLWQFPNVLSAPATCRTDPSDCIPARLGKPPSRPTGTTDFHLLEPSFHSMHAGTAEALVQAQGTQELIQEIVKRVSTEPAAPTGPFKFSIDHCFAIRGQGTVLTGTVLSGKAQVGDVLELPELKVSKKVKSMQMFKRPVQSCQQGDRVGICITQLDASLVERGIACTPGAVPTFTGAIAAVEKIRFFVGQVPSRLKVHVTVGHQTVMGEIQFFGMPDAAGPAEAKSILERMQELTAKGAPPAFDMQQEYVHQKELYGVEGRPSDPLAQAAVPETASTTGRPYHGPQWGLLHLSQPITASGDSVIIGSRLDASQDTPTCRLAFYGRLLKLIDPVSSAALQQLKIYKLKQKQGSIDRVSPDGLSAVCKGMFKKETDISLFAGMKVMTAQAEHGVIEGPFGKSGKFKVQFASGVSAPAQGSNSLSMTFKKFLFDKNRRRMAQ